MNNSLLANSDISKFTLPVRPKDGHKGTFGQVLIVAGSRDMSGAAYLAAKACYRAGAGLCRILTPRENLPVLAALLPEALLTGYNADAPELPILAKALSSADVLVLGCGMGTSSSARTVLSYFLRHRSIPTILDADALNLIAKSSMLLQRAKGAILTPHAKEMARLCGCSIEEINADPVGIAHGFAEKHGVVCVLKGHRTVVADGTGRIYENETGNCGMATGGSGDVLAGIIGGLAAGCRLEDSDLFRPAVLGVLLHGMSGDDAAARLGEYSVMASDLIDSLPHAIKELLAKQ